MTVDAGLRRDSSAPAVAMARSLAGSVGQLQAEQAAAVMIKSRTIKF